MKNYENKLKSLSKAKKVKREYGKFLFNSALKKRRDSKVSGGKLDVSNKLQEIYDEASKWLETNELRLLIVLDGARLLKAKILFTV